MKRPVLTGAIAAALLAALIAGCGGSARPARGGSARHARGGSAPASVLVGTTSSNAAVPIAPGQPQVQVTSFRSPGATITCQISSRSARCAVARPAWAPASPCPAAARQVLAVSRSGRVQFECGAAALPHASVTVKALPYGTVTVADGFACESYTGGVQCGERAGGQGFFISKPYRRLF